jgi:hypothetical protein
LDWSAWQEAEIRNPDVKRTERQWTALHSGGGLFQERDSEFPLSFLCLLPSSRPLSLAAGVKLLELLAEHVHMSSGSFINIR